MEKKAELRKMNDRAENECHKHDSGAANLVKVRYKNKNQGHDQRLRRMQDKNKRVECADLLFLSSLATRARAFDPSGARFNALPSTAR